jgi:hypothetical protein
MSLRLFEMVLNRVSSSLFESAIALAFFVGMLVVLVFRPQQIHSVRLFRTSFLLLVLAFVVPGTAEAVVYLGCQRGEIRVKEKESSTVSGSRESGTRSDEVESSITGCGSIVMVPAAQVVGNILLAVRICYGVLSLAGKGGKPEPVKLDGVKQERAISAAVGAEAS